MGVKYLMGETAGSNRLLTKLKCPKIFELNRVYHITNDIRHKIFKIIQPCTFIININLTLMFLQFWF